MLYVSHLTSLSHHKGSMACEDAGEIATNLWYSQANNYSYSDPRLNADTDTFTQVKQSAYLQRSLNNFW